MQYHQTDDFRNNNCIAVGCFLTSIKNYKLWSHVDLDFNPNPFLGQLFKSSEPQYLFIFNFFAMGR